MLILNIVQVHTFLDNRIGIYLLRLAADALYLGVGT